MKRILVTVLIGLAAACGSNTDPVAVGQAPLPTVQPELSQITAAAQIIELLNVEIAGLIDRREELLIQLELLDYRLAASRLGDESE